MALDEAFKTFTADLCFTVNPLYLIYPPYIPLPQRPSSQSMMSYLHQPSVISAGQLNHPHPVSKQLTDTLLLHQCSLYTSNYLSANTLAHLQHVNGSKAVKNDSIKRFWQTLFWLFNRSGVCFGFGQPQCHRTLSHYVDNQPLCAYVFYGRSLKLADCQIVCVRSDSWSAR